MSLIWGEQLGDYRALVTRVVHALARGTAGVETDEAVAASIVLMEAAGYLLSDERLFQDTVAATSPWLSRPDLSPLMKAGWLSTYAPLGRHWPTPGVKLPAPTPLGCLELSVRLAQAHGGPSAAFSGAIFLTQAAVADNDRAARNDTSLPPAR